MTVYTTLTLGACPSDLDAKAMTADRKQGTYTCRHCGRTWQDERIKTADRVQFSGPAHNQFPPQYWKIATLASGARSAYNASMQNVSNGNKPRKDEQL